MSSSRRDIIRKLVADCLEGNQTAWSELVEMIMPIVLSVCRSMGLSREDSVDVFGQTCFLLLENLHKLRSPEKVVSYASTTARREVLAMARRRKLFESAREAEKLDLGPSDQLTPETIFRQTEQAEVIIKALLRLPDKEAQLIWHLFLNEKEPSYEDISKALDMPVASIGPTRARALEKLNRILKKKKQ